MKGIRHILSEYAMFVVVLIGVLLSVLIHNNYYTHILLMCIVYSILASSLNIAVGMTGLSNLCHATFFGIGAYACAILNSRFGVPWYVAMVCGAFFAGMFGLILGIPTLRLKGVFLAVATEGFGQIIRVTEINWQSLTNGASGIAGIAGASLFGTRFKRTAYLYVFLLLLLLSMYVTKRIMKAKIGRALFAIKYDETAAKSMGINVTYHKIVAYVICAAIAGLAGSVYANYLTFISPDTFTPQDSTTILCMVILGGLGTLVGPVVGAVILTLIPEIFRFADLYRTIFVGLIMVVGVIFTFNNGGQKIRDFFTKLIGRGGTPPQQEGGGE